MNADLHGTTLRSRKRQFVLGDAPSIEMDFLAPARHMTAPEIHKLAFVLTGTITPVGGNALGRDFAKLIREVSFRDEQEMVKASGQSLRVLEQVEVGARQRDPADFTVAGGALPFTYRLNLYFVPSPNRAKRPRDFAVPLANLIEGGNLIVSMANVLPTNFGAVANDWSLQVYADVVDGRVRELKSRRRITEQTMNIQEFDYPVYGSIRNAILTSLKTDTDATDLTALATLYSRTLDFPPDFETHMLVDKYIANSESLGANDEISRGRAIPLVFPTREKKIGTMIDTTTLHVDLRQAALANMRLLTDIVVDRSPNIAAVAEGYGSPQALSMAIQQHGQIVGEGGNFPATHAPPALARRLPIRIKNGR